MNLRAWMCAATGFGFYVALIASDVTDSYRGMPEQALGAGGSGGLMTITVENDDVVLRWNLMTAPTGNRYVYRIYRGESPNVVLDEARLIAEVDGMMYRDQGVVSRFGVCFYRLEPVAIVNPAPLFNPPYPGVVIEDFESGSAVLYSYSNEDQQPNSWLISSNYSYGNTQYSLYLYGNTWKELRLDTTYATTAQTVWQVAMRSHRRGEIQGFGVGDSTRVLFYVVRGLQILNLSQYNETYHATLDDSVWTPYLFAVGSDWQAVYGDLPTITRLIFVNDNDAGSSHGNTYFDEILDVSANIPQPPRVHIIAIQNPVSLSGPYFVGSGPEVNLSFIGRVTDPDGDLMGLLWDFGDGSTSTELRPNHTFPRFPNITVALTATDSLGLVGAEVVRIPVSSPNVNGAVTMSFTGDVMMARRYEDPGGIIETYGADYIFHEVRDLLESVNVSVCNLESPLTDDGTPHPTKQIVFRSSPENASALTYAGFEMVSLANNHVWDYMDPGMIETMDVLDQQGILHTGAGMDCILARQPAYITRNGIRIALIGLCNRTGRADGELPFLEAGMSKGGLAMLDYASLDATIPYARETADRVFVFLHSGEEYTTGPDVDDMIEGDLGWDNYNGHEPIFRTEPTDQEQELRQYAIDLGADMVINSHPHVLQGFEVYNGKLIAHSLGNFAFDQYYWETYPSVLVKTAFDSADVITEVSLHPIYIDDYVPVPATGTLGTSILERLMDYSRELNTIIVPNDSNPAVGIVVFDTAQVQETWHDRSATIAMRQEATGVYISQPLLLFDDGASPATILSVTHNSVAVPCSVALGRDLLWVGGFEDEGSTIWNLNSSTEWYETTNIHSGARALGLSRSYSVPGNVITELEDRCPSNVNYDYTMMGWIKTINAERAAMVTMWYDGRTSGNNVRRDTVSTPISGNADWTFKWEHMNPPNNGTYINIRCNLFAPDSGTGYAYFDDLAFVQWIGWVGQLPYPVAYPNNFRYLKVFSEDLLDSVTVNYCTVSQSLP